jgi:hypothetical protein
MDNTENNLDLHYAVAEYVKYRINMIYKSNITMYTISIAISLESSKSIITIHYKSIYNKDTTFSFVVDNKDRLDYKTYSTIRDRTTGPYWKTCKNYCEYIINSIVNEFDKYYLTN